MNEGGELENNEGGKINERGEMNNREIVCGDNYYKRCNISPV